MRRGFRDDPETGDFPGERVFSSWAEIKYVLQSAARESDTLAVGFSSAQKPNEPPRYRWHKALHEVPCHRLYLLDDHGPGEPVPGPSWYLGRGRGFLRRRRRFEVADSLCDLVDRITEELDVPRDRVVTFGSSMGGWAALYFGARFGAGHTIAAEPQTMLGQYLCGTAFHTLAEHMVGGSSRKDREFLDAMVFDAVRAAEAPSRVVLYCGRDSPYYERHVQPLVELLDELGLASELELGDFSEHGELVLGFPAFLVGRLTELCGSTTGLARPGNVESSPDRG